MQAVSGDSCMNKCLWIWPIDGNSIMQKQSHLGNSELKHLLNARKLQTAKKISLPFVDRGSALLFFAN